MVLAMNRSVGWRIYNEVWRIAAFDRWPERTSLLGGDTFAFLGLRGSWSRARRR
jgi:hypothetical protein